MKNKNFKLVFTLYFIIFGVFITALSTLISYNVHMVNIQDVIERYAQEISYSKINDYLKPNIDKMNFLAEALANDKTLINYVKTKDPKKLAELNNLFLTVANSEKNIMQVRYIDAKGKEMIRVDRDNMQSFPHIIPRAKLQDKSLRDYFIAIKQMNKQKIWHSDIDLNIENGKIEVPYRPTFRIAVPLFEDNKFAGTVILNMLVHQMFSAIQSSPIFNIYIIDKDGNYIVHPDEKYSWNKYTEVKRKLYEDFPKSASNILSGGIKGKNFFAYKLNQILQNDDGAVLLLQPKKEIERSLKNENLLTSAIVALLSVLLSIPLAMYAARAPSKLQKTLQDTNLDLQRFAQIIDKYVITATTNLNGFITDVSSAFSKTSGYSKKELLNQNMNIIKDEDTPRSVYKDIWDTILSGRQWNGEIKNKTKNGESYWLEQTIFPIKTIDDKTISFMSVGTEITAKKRLEVISTIDKLTNVFNRRRIDELLSLEIEKARRYGEVFSLVLIDIDHFKKVNDTFGHHTGDEVLKGVAAILQNNIRKLDFLGRYGGEEFMIICPETGKDGTMSLAEDIRRKIDEHAFATVDHVTISMGVTTYRDKEDDEASLFKKCDAALYLAKNEGRNRVVHK
ncbi:diguanylate cyclase [Sulfurimonas sp. HSL-1716]|uniref:sensor domain-containing diguanylate cyclase n=1 Tax=Hydrocurvibacter sulfurireducens TaxID=3131937 RepID=UPI0031F8BBEC